MAYAALPAPGPILWLEQALAEDPGRPCPPLEGPTRADVVVVGGGFVGLWTAYELSERAPDLDVVLLEAEFCGAGASGRNGGWVSSWYDHLDLLIERFGAPDALRLADEAAAAVARIGEVAARHGISCDYRQAGALMAATAPAQLDVWDDALEACRAHGREALFHRLPGHELRARTGSPLPVDGVRQADGAAVQPARLVRGLRRVLLERGVRIYEGSVMAQLRRTRPALVETREGRVEADRVVLALGAWSARLRELRRAVVPVGSHIVATEPIPDRVRELGWTGGETFGDARLLVHYAQVSQDGRIVFGRGGGALGPAGRVTAAHHRDARTLAGVAADFRRFFPSLADVRLTHGWGGPVDRAPGKLPWVGRLGDAGSILYATGFSGNGVGPSAVLARVLAAAVLDERAASPLLLGRPPALLPPEPLRTVGGVLVRAAVARAEAVEERGGTPDVVTGAIRGLVSFTMPRVRRPRATARPHTTVDEEPAPTGRGA